MTTPAIPPAEPPKTDNEKAAFVVGIIGLCFGALAAAWSFIGGACCGWAGWGWGFLGLVLSVVSLCLKRSSVGWAGLMVSGFAFAWVIIQPMLVLTTAGTGAAVLSQGAATNYPRPLQPKPSGKPTIPSAAVKKEN